MPPRKKLELLGLVERVIEMWDRDKMTHREIEAVLRREGFDVSRGAIQRTLKEYKDVAETFQRGLREAEKLIEAVKAHPNTDIVELSSTLLAQHILDYVKDIDGLEFADGAELSKAIARLSRAQVNVARLRLEHTKGFDAAKKAVLAELGRELSREPGLLEKLSAVVERLKPNG